MDFKRKIGGIKVSIYDKAKELADAITTSDELRRVKEAELKMMIDLPSREIVEEYQRIQMEAINSGISYEDLADDKKERLNELEKQMNKNEIIVEYMTSNQELNQVLESVNMIISSALTGGSDSGCSSCSSAGNCGESSCCSSCGH